MVHTAVTEKKDPRKEVHKYLMSYRAAPHKTTGKSPYELLFNRKMATKLPHLQIKINKDLDREVRSKHDAAKEKQKSYADGKRRAKMKGGSDSTPAKEIISQASMGPPTIHCGGRPRV